MRECPFKGCGKEIPDHMFACAQHWHSLNQQQKARIWDAYNRYRANRIDLDRLREIQEQVLSDAGAI